MQTAIISFIFEGDMKRQMDLEVPLKLSIHTCVEMLRSVNWLPDSTRFRYELSVSGEQWTIVNEHDVLSEIFADEGSLLKIIPYKK